MVPPLSDLLVIDASSYLTGPFATMMLADLGAEVVKVERPPKGDPLRRIGHRYQGLSVQWFNVNRNKRSVDLDLHAEEDRETLLRLVEGADVFVQNWRPGVAEALGLGDAVLARRNPRLVRVAISGYGPDGPFYDRPAFDSLIQAQSGLAHRQRERRDGRPETVRTYIADKVTSAMAAQAVLAALVARSRTGRGERIDVAMLDAVSYFNFPDLMEERTFLEDPAARDEPPLPRPFIVATADGHIALAPATGPQLKAAFAAVNHSEWLEEIRRKTDHRTFVPAAMDALESATVDEKSATWLERFAAVDVPAAEVLNADGHLADAQVVHNEIYGVHHHPELGPMRFARYPARFAGSPPDPLRCAAPEPGQHTADIIRQARRSWTPPGL